MAQQRLPLEEADAAAAEQRAVLMVAVQKVGGDLHLWRFCETVLDWTQRGRAFRATYRELTSPQLLWASLSKVRSTVERAIAARLVQADPIFVGAAEQGKSYCIDFEGVSRILRGEIGLPRSAAGLVDERSAAVGGAGPGDDDLAPDGDWDIAVAATPPALTEQTPVARRQGPALWRQGSASTEQGSGPRAGPGARGALPVRSACAPARFGFLPSVENLNTKYPVPVPEPDPVPDFGKRADSGALGGLAAWFRESPILREAVQRRIAPQPSERLLHGVFKPLEAEHLDQCNTAKLVLWFRGQLASPVPVDSLAATEAHLLLTIAAAIYATSLPAQQVKRSRVAAFVNCLTRNLWKAVPYVPAARARLDAWLAWCDAHGRNEGRALYASAGGGS